MKAALFSPRIVLLFLVGTLAAMPAAAVQNPPPAQPVGPMNRELTVYPLKHTDAIEVARVLQEMFMNNQAPGRSVRVHADARTNSVLVEMTNADKGNVEKLIKLLDVSAKETAHEGNQVVLVRLKHLVPDADLEKALQVVFLGRPGKFAVDKQRKVVVLSGDRQLRQAAEALLKTLDDAQAGRQTESELQVRIVWLVSGLKREDAAAAPADLAEVVAELAKLGVEKPRMAAQILVNAPVGAPFQVSGSAVLESPCRLVASGTLNDKTGAPILEIDLGAMREGQQVFGAGRGSSPSGQICQLRTQITTPLGHAVVVGMTPTEGMTSIFVIQVLRKDEPRRKQ